MRKNISKKSSDYDISTPRPKKSLGQNFLKSESALRKIRDAADPTADDIILEIGPGLGALTETLLPFVGKMIAIEKDDTLYSILSEKFKIEIDIGKLDLINGDVLHFDPGVLQYYDKTYKLVANIPYNITGAIIQKFTEAIYQPSMIVVLVQREVAERVVARDGHESILSICVQAYGNPSYIATVKAGSFHPAPRVDSAILKIDNISRDRFMNIDHEDIFFNLVKTGFAHPRKMVISNLSQLFDRETITRFFHNLGLPENIRAEKMSINDWSNLSVLVYTDAYGK